MKLLISLLLCASLLAGCYRQTEEPFQQVDSAVVVDLTPTSLASVVEVAQTGAPNEGAVADADEAAPTRVPYITPETVPGQIAQPTPDLPTRVPLVEVTDAPLSVTRFVLPSPTLSFEEQLDPADPCVYSIVLGDTLFRLSLAWATTVQEIMDLNQLESDALAIDQLLLIPGCERSEPAATATVAPVIAEPDADTADTAPVATEAEPEDTPTPGPRIHVVSAGETLESISLRYRADVNQIIALNNLANPDRLSVGQELLLPE